MPAQRDARDQRRARLRALAERVWEDADDAGRFLTTPHALLGGSVPIDLAASDLGARRVEELLWKLEYSLPV